MRTGVPCNENRFFPVRIYYTGKTQFWPCSGPVRDCSVPTRQLRPCIFILSRFIIGFWILTFWVKTSIHHRKTKIGLTDLQKFGDNMAPLAPTGLILLFKCIFVTYNFFINHSNALKRWVFVWLSYICLCRLQFLEGNDILLGYDDLAVLTF